MTFNISEFSAQINRKGLAKNNLFFVTITPPNMDVGVPAGDLSFLCRSVQIPGLNIDTTGIQNQGYGRPESRPTGMSFENLETEFMVDSDFGVSRFFHRWVQRVVNYDNSAGYNYEHQKMLPFETNFKHNYAGTIVVFVYSYGEDMKYRYEFQNAFPIQTGSVTHAWADQTEVLTMPISFAYDSYRVDGLGRSSKAVRPYQGRGLQGALSRGFGGGLSDFIFEIGNFGAGLSGLGIDNNLQDFVNDVTSVAGTISSTANRIDAILNLDFF